MGSNLPLMKEDGVCEIMFGGFKQKGYHHSRADGVFYIESSVYTRQRRVAAIQRLTVETTASKTVNENHVNFRDFLKNFHFIPSRFEDTLRQTKSTTFTVVYEYVCVYGRDEAVRSERKKTTHVIGSLSSPAVSTVPQPLASYSSAQYQTLLSRTGR